MKVSGISNQIRTISQVVKNNKNEAVSIARRYSQTKNVNKATAKVVEAKAVIKHVLKPFFDWASKKSDTIKVIKETANKVNRNINKHVGRAMDKNPKASKIIAGVRGVDASLPAIGTAALVVSGVKDVKDAKKEKGTTAGIKEAGKSFVRVTTSAAMATAGALLVPVPGMATAGWLVGENLAKLAVGKPYSAKNKTPDDKEVKIDKD